MEGIIIILAVMAVYIALAAIGVWAEGRTADDSGFGETDGDRGWPSESEKDDKSEKEGDDNDER